MHLILLAKLLPEIGKIDINFCYNKSKYYLNKYSSILGYSVVLKYPVVEYNDNYEANRCCGSSL